MRRLFVNSNIILRLLGLLSLMLLGMASIVGSGGGDDITGGGATLTSISISPSVVPKDMLPGLEQQFVAIGTYSDNSQQILSTGVDWASSSPGVANVNASGLATGISAGATDITAAVGAINSNAVALTVVNPGLLSIQVSPPTVPNGLPVGASQQFIAMGVYNNNQIYDITDTVAWSSDDTNVVTIDSSGLATGQGATTASANISASSDMVSSNVVNVAVSVQTAVGLIVEPKEGVPLPVNRTQQFTALLLYANDTTFDVTDEVQWSSNDPSVATVINDNSAGSKGLVTGVSTGRVAITATHTIGQSGDGVFDVTSATIQAVNIDPATPGNIPAEHTQNFTAEGEFTDGINRQLTAPNWFVDDSSVATFNYRGTTAQVLGVAAGSASLIYLDTLADGMLSGQTDTVPLTITSAVLDTIVISPSPATIADGTELLFTATGNFDDTSTRDITQDVWWETGDNTVAGFSVIPGQLTALFGVNNSATAQAKRVNSQDVLKASPTANVIVQDATLNGLTIVPPGSPVSVWETDQYTVTASFDNGTSADYTERVTWSVLPNNPINATVSTASGTKGQVTGVRAGPATLRVIDPQTGTSQDLAITISSP